MALNQNLALQAAAHQKEMERKYVLEINKAALSSDVFTDHADIPEREICSKQRIFASDSVSAAEKLGEGKVAILNFADYTRAGGLFLRGSHAQEESLCHASTLFNILNNPALADYYKWNKGHKNGSLYMNRAIYTPEVTFTCGKQFDVLTCAAPYAKTAKRGGATQDQINEAMKGRIHFIHEILEHEMVDTAILGAYGCGVFGNDPETVARLFKEEFEKAGIRNVIYAIPGGRNLIKFRETFQ